MRECNDDVLFGMTRLSSSRLIGRDSPDRGLEVKEGAMLLVFRSMDRRLWKVYAGRCKVSRLNYEWKVLRCICYQRPPTNVKQSAMKDERDDDTTTIHESRYAARRTEGKASMERHRYNSARTPYCSGRRWFNLVFFGLPSVVSS